MNPDSSAERDSPEPSSETTRLYRDFLAEREEILRHKWLRSEEQGQDIGFESALLEWTVQYRSGWLESRSDER